MSSKNSLSNQQKIAENLNISRTTVSRCFTNHSGVNPDTRAKVFSEAKRLGYTYLEQRNIKKKAAITVGVIICTDFEEIDEDHYQSPGFNLMPGISEYSLLHNMNVDIHIISSKYNADSPEFIKLVKDNKRNWNGLLLIYPFNQDIISALTAQFPCVSLVEQFGDQTLDCVDVDHYRGISKIVNELVNKGHSKIGFITRKYAIEACWSYRRFSALSDKMMRMGLTLDKKNVINIFPGTFKSPYDANTEALKRTKEGVTAWVCAADHIGYDLIERLEAIDVQIKEEVSVVGFDGIQSPLKKHTLSTIKIPHREIGYHATKRLNEIIKNPYNLPQHISINGELLSGNTLGTA